MKYVSKKEVKKVSDLISIVVLASNQLIYTKLCIESIKSSVSLPYELIVITSDISDNSINYLNKYGNTKLILNQANYSFAEAANQGIKASSGDYILLVNNNVLISKNCLNNLLRCIKSSSNIGLVGPRTNNYAAGDQGGIIDVFVNLDKIIYFSDNFNKSNPNKWFPVRELYSFCLFIKRELIEKIGLFNENLTKKMWADTDFCFRAKKANYQLLCAGDTFVFQFINKTIIKKKFLIVGHPRSGTGFMAKLLQSFGYDVRHEAMGKDGISSWMFAVKDYQPWTDKILNRKDFEFKYLIMNLRNPLDIVSSTYFTEEASLPFRKKHLNIVGLNKLEIAVESVIKWYRLIEEQRPDLIIKVDQKPKEKLLYYLKRFEDETLILPDSNVSKKENSRKHPKLKFKDLRESCSNNIVERFADFCYLYNYNIF